MEFDVKTHLKNKYKDYNIPESIIDKIESEEIQGYYVDILIKKTIQLENYIIEQIKKDDLEKELLVLEQHSSLKTIIKYNKICLKLLDELANKEGLSIDKVINKLYEDALEKSLSNYNDNRLISENILYNMQIILLQKFGYDVSSITTSFSKPIEKLEKEEKNNTESVKNDLKSDKSKKEKKKERTLQKDINIEFNKTTFDTKDVPNIRKMISLEYLLKLTDYKSGAKTKDDAIIFLLFGGIDEQYYKNSEVAKALNISEEYVNEVYLRCLEEYKNSLENTYKNDIKNKKLGLSKSS